MAMFAYAFVSVFVMQTLEHTTACYPSRKTDGKWTSWGPWSDRCPQQRSIRSRSCTDPPPAKGGKPCIGHTQQTDTRPCPSWSTWTVWTSCPVTCGVGSTERTRECKGGTGCLGLNMENNTCNIGSCPDDTSMAIDGEWAEWDPWSQCSTICGGGIQQRTRNCSDPAPQHGGSLCSGNTTETRKCADWICPDCSRTCPGNGRLVNCSVCMCNDTKVTGLVIDVDDSLPLFHADVFVVGREWKPYATSDANGKFLLENVCTSGLKLTMKKPGYKGTRGTYDVITGPNLLEMRKLEKPQFLVEPSSQAGFVNQSVILLCNATSDPPPTHYDWFKNGNLIRHDVAESTGGADLRLTNLQLSDGGQYACRAVSEGGKIFSKLANLVVKESGNDTCDSVPAELMVALPPTCHVGASMTKTMANVGKCRNDPCVKTSSSLKSEMCCSPIETEPVNIVCNDFGYNLTKVIKCGCAHCNEIAEIVVTVRVKAEKVDDALIQYGGETLSLEADGMVSFEAVPRAGRVNFTVTSFYTYMPRLVTLDVVDGLSQMFVEVSLASRPEPINVDAVKGGNLVVPSSGESSSAVSVEVPPNAFVDEFSDLVTSTVKVYVSYADPRNETSIDSAPGEFTYEDEEGETRLLQTFGVVTLFFEDSDGNPVHLRGNVTLMFNKTALGIENDEEGNPDVQLWVIDAASGQWKKSGTMTNSDNRRRRKRDANTGDRVKGETLIPRYVPYVNCDRPFLRGRLCSIAVYVYYGAEFSTTLPGERISAFMIENRRFIGRTSGYTDANGRACLLVACGLEHIVKLESGEGVLVHPTHYLPGNFSVVNRTDGFRFTATPPSNREENIAGPVFRYRRWNSQCYKANSTSYHFKLAKPSIRPSLYGSLNAVEMRPGRPLSWFPSMLSEKKMCALQVQIMSSESSKIQVVGISSASNGELYGAYAAALQMGYKACVLFRCPSNDSDYTSVDLHVAYDNSSLCVMRYPSVKNNDNDLLHTNTSIRVLRHASPGYGEVFYSATGKGDLAFYRVMKQCNSGWTYVAMFDCSVKTVRSSLTEANQARVL